MRWETEPQRGDTVVDFSKPPTLNLIFFILSLVLKFLIVNNHLGRLSLPCNDFIFCLDGSHLIFRHSAESNDLEENHFILSIISFVRHNYHQFCHKHKNLFLGTYELLKLHF